MIAERLGLFGRAALVLFALLMLQVGLVSDLPVLEAVGDLMLLSAIAAGSVGGADRGATYGFVAGILYDLMLDTPFGLNALTYAVAGFAAGWVAGRVLQPRWWFHVGTTAAITLGAVLLTVFVANFVGEGFPADDIWRMCLVETVWNAVLILPARRLLAWVFGEEDPLFSRFALTR
jgi:rod shape-determining protein MreD